MDLLQKLAIELSKQMEYRFFDGVKTTFGTAPRANDDIEPDGQFASMKPKSSLGRKSNVAFSILIVIINKMFFPITKK